MTLPESSYAKPFLTVPEQVRRLRERGMDCGDDAYAAEVLERYGYYRLSGYWHIYRDRPAHPAAQYDDGGREIRLNTFMSGASLSRVVALYEFDHKLRTRLGDVLSTIEVAIRFFIGHQLGKVDKFAHRVPDALDAVREAKQCPHAVLTNKYRDWLKEYNRDEKRARGDFVAHFREKYGPHLPIWVATEVMSFGVLSNLYRLMRQSDKKILAARFQVHAADGRGDCKALANWLNSLRNVRNICAHYGRVWNRTFDVIIDVPGQARRSEGDRLAPLADDGVNNRLYGVLLVIRHLMLSIDPGNTNVVDLTDYIDKQSQILDFDMRQLGFPANWKDSLIWDPTFALDRSPMMAASLLDRTESLTAPNAREALTSAEPKPKTEPRTLDQQAAATRAAQKSLLRKYLQDQTVIEIELGGTKYYPAFQFRDGKIIDALADINQKLALSCGDAERTIVAKALLDWWLTPHPSLLRGTTGAHQSPLDLLNDLPEADFAEVVRATDVLSSFVVPGPGSV